MPPDDAARLLNGREVTDAESVLDYVHLVLGEIGLTITAPMSIVTPENVYRPNMPGLVESLRSRVGHLVRHAETTAERLNLEFDDGVRVEVSLCPDDQVSPEAAVMEGKSLDKIYVW